MVGEMKVEGLAKVPAGNQILVRLDLDLSGILKVTAIERATGMARHVMIDSAMERFRTRQRSDAVDRLEAMMGGDEETSWELEPGEADDETVAADPELHSALEAAGAMRAKAERVLPVANAEDADELRAMLEDLEAAVDSGSAERIRAVLREVEDLVFYLES